MLAVHDNLDDSSPVCQGLRQSEEYMELNILADGHTYTCEYAL